MDLTGKTVVVSGGSDGIGKHICLKLAAKGCSLAILGRNRERLADVVAQSLKLGAEVAIAYDFDLINPVALEQTAKVIISDFGHIDILINNAGIWHKTGPLDSIDADLMHAIVQTNLTALMQLTRHFLPVLRDRPQAALLNVVSKSGVLAQAGQSVYTATKFGVRGFSEVLKQDESHVRIACLYQSGTNTDMFAKAGEDVPIELFTEPKDLADVVVFMLSRPAKLWMHDVRVEI